MTVYIRLSIFNFKKQQTNNNNNNNNKQEQKMQNKLNKKENVSRKLIKKINLRPPVWRFLSSPIFPERRVFIYLFIYLFLFFVCLRYWNFPIVCYFTWILVFASDILYKNCEFQVKLIRYTDFQSTSSTCCLLRSTAINL